MASFPADDEELAQGVEAMDEDVVVDDDGDDLVEDDFDGDVPPPDDDDDDDDGPGMAEEDEDAGDEAEKVVEEAALKLAAHGDAVYAVALAERADADGGRGLVALTGGGDDVAFLTRLDVDSSSSSTTCLRGHTDSVTCVGFSWDAALCGTGSYDGSVRVWSTDDASLIQTLEGPGDVEWLEFHPRGDVLAAGSQDGTVWLWQARTGECLRVFAGHDGPVSCGFFASDGNSILSGSADGTVRHWAPKKGTCRHVYTQLSRDNWPVVHLAKKTLPGDSDGAHVVAAALDGPAVAVLHLKAKKVVAQLALASDRVATAVSLCGASPWLAAGDDAGTVTVFDYAKAVVRLTAVHAGAVVDLKWHDLGLVVAFSDPPRLRHFDARTGALLYDFSGHTDAILALDFRVLNSGHHFLLSAGDDQQPRLFHAAPSLAANDVEEDVSSRRSPGDTTDGGGGGSSSFTKIFRV